MSNRQRLPGSGPVLRCAVHGGRIGKASRSVRLGDGRAVCVRCVDDGALLRRLGCGHMATAGNTVVRIGDSYICAFCARRETL